MEEGSSSPHSLPSVIEDPFSRFYVPQPSKISSNTELLDAQNRQLRASILENQRYLQHIQIKQQMMIQQYNNYQMQQGFTHNPPPNAYWPVPMTPPPVQVIDPSQGMKARFVLLEQPSMTQRKSYSSECRYLTPNPLVIAPRQAFSNEKLSQILDGVASVRLVDTHGNDPPDHLKSALEVITGNPIKLDEKKNAPFSLKISQTSDGVHLRLEFSVAYRTEMGHFEEKILSRPFIVVSNIRKQVKEVPVVVALNGPEGPHNIPNEVWIKGFGLEKVEVKFGDYKARIIESASNLIVVQAPPRRELIRDETVKVEVYVKSGGEFLYSENKPTYTYRYVPDLKKNASVL